VDERFPGLTAPHVISKASANSERDVSNAGYRAGFLFGRALCIAWE
jgi:hypothetical protein